MKKVSLFMLPIMATALLFTGCKDNNVPEGDTVKSVATVSQAALTEAVAGMYAEWENTTTVPEEISVSGSTLTAPQYQYAMAKLLLNIRDGVSGDIEVLNYRAADHPDRDSYDADDIAVFNGPANGDETEDLGNVAGRMLAAMEANGQVPNQTLFYRGETALAFSTNRATVCFARAIAAYAADGTMPASVSSEYLTPAPSIARFAAEYVKILDVWESTVGTCNYVTGIGATTEAEFVEFDQADAHYVPDDYVMTIGTNTYNKADIFEIALRSYLLLRGYDGYNTSATGAASFAELKVEAVDMSAEISETHSYYWNDAYTSPYSAYNESAGNGGELRMTDGSELVRMDILDNFAMRAVNFRSGAPISNNCGYGGGQVAGYTGSFSSQRALLTYAHFFKYMLDNNLNDVSTISEDQTFTTVLFYPAGYRESLITLKTDTESLSFEVGGGSAEIGITSTAEAWTASCSESWVTVTPAEGPASETATTVTIAAAENTGAARTATVVVGADGQTVEIEIAQKGVPGVYTIKDFATEYVKLLDVWAATTGTVNYVKGPGEVTEGDNAGFNVYDAHYIPLETTITVDGTELTTAQTFEMALRCYLLLRGYDGANTTAVGAAAFEPLTVTPAKMSDVVPELLTYTWGASPWNETGTTAVGGASTGNGGGLRMGDPAVGTVAAPEVVKTDVLDNFAFRAVNRSNKAIANMCGYAAGQLSGYFGCFSAHRGLVTYAHFFKYVLDNNLEDLSTISADQTFESHNLQ